MRNSYLIRSKNIFLSLLCIIVVILVSSQLVLAKGNVSKVNLFRIGNDINIKEGEVVNTIFSIGGKVVIDGEVRGRVIAIGKLISVGGKVDKDIASIGNNIVLKEGSIVGGDVISIGGRVFRWADTEVKGKIKEINRFGFNREFNRDFENLPFGSPRFFYWRNFYPLQIYFEGNFKLFKLITLLIVVGLAVALFSKQIRNIATFVSKEPGESLLFGILGMILIIPLVIILGLSIIGIPLIFLLIIFIIIASLLGVVSIYFLIGQRFLTTFNFKNTTSLWGVFIGLIILELIRTIPHLGGIIMLTVYLFGFGAVIKTRFGSKTSV